MCGTQKQSICGLLACKAWEEVLQSTKSQPACSVCSAVFTWGLQACLHLQHSLHSACRQGNSRVDGEVSSLGTKPAADRERRQAAPALHLLTQQSLNVSTGMCLDTRACSAPAHRKAKAKSTTKSGFHFLEPLSSICFKIPTEPPLSQELQGRDTAQWGELLPSRINPSCARREALPEEQR